MPLHLWFFMKKNRYRQCMPVNRFVSTKGLNGAWPLKDEASYQQDSYGFRPFVSPALTNSCIIHVLSGSHSPLQSKNL